MKNEVARDIQLISYCGLYCAACRGYLKGKCAGCHNNEKATWCKVRTCCISNHYQSCADCKEFSDPANCKKYNNVVSKIFGFIFRSNRNACIAMIKNGGYENFAAFMAEHKLQTIKR
jgi:hypothetical protein